MVCVLLRCKDEAGVYTGLAVMAGRVPVLGVFTFPRCTQGSESAQHLARVWIYRLIIESKITRSRSLFSQSIQEK